MVTPNDRELRRARELARILDTAIGIPGTPIRVGLDAILGLIPGAGDVAGALLSAYIILTAIRGGAPPAVIWRMLGNVGLDTLGGALPIIGDLFDVAYKSNIRNVELLERYAAEPAKVVTRSHWLGVLVVALVVLLLLALAAGGILLARLVWQLMA